MSTSSLAALYPAHVSGLVQQYAQVLEKHQLDAIVLHSGSPLKKSVFDDQYWPLTVVPHTRHWLPLAVADCAVVVGHGQTPKLLRNVARDFWEGPPEVESDHFWS